MIPHTFGESAPWSVGIEEELFVLDAETLQPAAFPRELFGPPRIKQELFASVVELNTGICGSVAEAAEELGGLRAEAKRRAADAGLVLAAAGTWPAAVPEEQGITEDEGYRRFVEFAGSSARRQYCSGLHVHVGVTSPEACMEALEAVLPWLPLALALSANSPYLAGRESGLDSTRAEIIALLPRAGSAAGLRFLPRVGGVRGTPRRSRPRGRVHAHLVGRPSASALRDARSAHARPAHQPRGNGRPRRGRARARQQRGDAGHQ